jgi:urease accessory protein
MRTKLIQSIAVMAALMCCGVAQAHSGHGDGFAAGLAHPLLGLDHLLAMLAVGVWAFQIGGHARWIVPASFVTLMALAGSLGMSGIVLPMVESGIATSVLVLGLLIAFSVKMKLVPGALLVSLFAAFHGSAHGLELPAFNTPWAYVVGFVVSTAALHGLGLLLGRGLRNDGLWLRAAGSLLAASGAWMMVTA